ncbi:MAG: hypothetical protein ACKOX6_04495 [Bdellovibrio sp.]
MQKITSLKCLILIIGIIQGSQSLAASFTLSKGNGYTIEPLYGYETVFRDYPTAHLQTRAMYGARVTLGADILSAELEYMKASDTENFSTAPQTIKIDDEKLKLGIRSTYRFNDYIYSSVRLGAQATKSTHEEISGGISDKKEKPIAYNPYAGASLGVRFGVLSINLSSTVIFRDSSDMSKNDYQNTISAGIGY